VGFFGRFQVTPVVKMTTQTDAAAAATLLQDALATQIPVHVLVTMEGCGHCVNQCAALDKAKYGQDGTVAFIVLPLKIVPAVADKIRGKYKALADELDAANAFPTHIWRPLCGCILTRQGGMSVDAIRVFPSAHRASHLPSLHRVDTL
jgi:hypothetical protein